MFTINNDFDIGRFFTIIFENDGQSSCGGVLIGINNFRRNRLSKVSSESSIIEDDILELYLSVLKISLNNFSISINFYISRKEKSAKYCGTEYCYRDRW